MKCYGLLFFLDGPLRVPERCDGLASALFDVSDFAVAHVEDAVCYLCCLVIVGDHQDGLLEVAAGSAEHAEDGVGVFGVEIAGWLVGKDDGGPGDECSGDGDALLLASGEFIGTVVEATIDAQHVGELIEEWLVYLFFGRAEVGDIVGDFDVAHGREGRQEVEALEDEADFGAAHFGALGVVEGGEVSAIDAD